PASPQVEVKDDLNPTLAATLNAIVKQVALNRALTAAGADPTAVQTAVASASIQLVFLDPNAALKTQQTVVGIFVAALLYTALLYAAGGSLVSRQEDLASVTSPLTMLVLGTYLAFFWVEANPTNPLAVALSIIPPLSPILMPARMATGDAQAWQVILAVALAI